MTITAYSYGRYSSLEQGKGWSFKRQLEKSEKLCLKHGWTLDTTLKLFDAGKSGYAYTGRKKGKHDLVKTDQFALSEFLNAIEKGIVKAGSILIIERLDRLSRSEVMDAVAIINKIVSAGVIIVTSDPFRQIDKKYLTEEFGIVMVVLELMVSRNESQKKSEHSRDNWAESRRKARENGEPITGRFRSWLKIEGKKFVATPEKVAVIRRIFGFAVKRNWGAKKIARHLNENGVENIAVGFAKTCKKTWNHVHVRNILTDRAVIGEFQPHITVNKKRVPEGEPIRGLYPAIIDEPTYYAAQSAGSKRKTNLGNSGTETRTLFTGFLRNAIDGDTLKMLTSINHKKGVQNRRLQGSTGQGSWKYEHFEEGFLRFLNEVKFDDLHDDTPDELSPLEGELSVVRTNIGKLKAKIAGGADVDVFADLLADLGQKQKKIKQQIEDLKGKATKQPIHETRSIIEQLKNDDSVEIRDRLKSAMRRSIDEVWVLIEKYEGPVHETRLATVQVFVGKESRSFVLGRKANRWFYLPLTAKGKYKFDLRVWRTNPKPLYESPNGVVTLPIDGFDEPAIPPAKRSKDALGAFLDAEFGVSV